MRKVPSPKGSSFGRGDEGLAKGTEIEGAVPGAGVRLQVLHRDSLGSTHPRLAPSPRELGAQGLASVIVRMDTRDETYSSVGWAQGRYAYLKKHEFISLGASLTDPS